MTEFLTSYILWVSNELAALE